MSNEEIAYNLRNFETFSGHEDTTLLYGVQTFFVDQFGTNMRFLPSADELRNEEYYIGTAQLAQVGQIVGAIVLNVDRNPIGNRVFGGIEWLATDRQYRNNGIGGRLAEIAETKLAESGCMYSQATPILGTSAERFWHKRGYEARKDTILPTRYKRIV